MGKNNLLNAGATSAARQACAQFGGGPAFLGFQYQTRYALLLLLRDGKGGSIYLEKTDDISLDRDGATTEQIQTKHRTRTRPLGDASPDLWRTLHNWSVGMREGTIDPSSHTLMLVTTSPARDNTVASLLGPNPSNRNVEKAL